MRYSQECCWRLRHLRTLCYVVWVIPSTSQNFNIFVFKTEAVEDQFFTLDCLTFEGEGRMILLTLILLTWRIWWAPNNASKWQMRFDSVFKGLKCRKLLAQWHGATSQKNWIVGTVIHSANQILCFLWFVFHAFLCNLFQMKPTRCTLLLSIFISTSVHVLGNYEPIIRGTYCIYATLVFFTVYG